MPLVRDLLVVLAGGRSSRFGRDKACEPFGSRREPLALRVLRRLAPLAATRVLVRAAPLADLPTDVVAFADPLPGSGPAQALVAAFAAHPAARWFVAPCDLPWLDVAAYRLLQSAMGSAPVAVARSERGVEPLVSMWTPRAAAALADRLHARPGLALHEFLDEIGAAFVDGLRPSCFVNVNTPADFAVACGAVEEE